MFFDAGLLLQTFLELWNYRIEGGSRELWFITTTRFPYINGLA